MNLTSNQIGNLGEAKAITDFIAHRGNNLWVVEVKTRTTASKRNTYDFDLTGTAYGPNRTVKHKSLNEDINILVCYVQPLDTLCYVNAKSIKNIRAMTFRESRTFSGGTHVQRIISDHIDLENAL